ncbi:MAG TPA: PDZ domain-containing protein [Pirellulaceae bacterium]|jgi:hypothetical protein|nr:PDZ domain-containing protein [Pirellulaceae bacterium]
MASSQLRRYPYFPFPATAWLQAWAISAIRPTARPWATGVLAALVLGATLQPLSAQGNPAPTTGEASAVDAAELVEQLDSDAYDQRERATTRLSEAGAAAIDPLTERLPRGSREMIARGMYVLTRLSLSREEATAERARQTLEAFAADPETPLGRQAEIALDDLNAKILTETVARLRDLGAEIKTQIVSDAGLVRENVASLSIGEDWRGEPKDLELVRRLGGASDVRLSGARFDDAAVAIVADLENLQTLTLKKVKLTAAGLANLEQVDSLSELQIFYCSGDEAIPTLEKLRSLDKLRLYGTKLTGEGTTRLEQTFGPNNQMRLDVRRGAFLGIRGDKIQEGALIMEVVEGSAAADAGMRPGDILVRIDDKPVPDFETVLTHVAQFLPGHEVKFGVLRNGERFERKVVLGEW